MTSTENEHVLVVSDAGRISAGHNHPGHLPECAVVNHAVRAFASPPRPRLIDRIRAAADTPPPGLYRITLAEDGNLDIGGRLRLDEAERISFGILRHGLDRIADEFGPIVWDGDRLWDGDR